MIDQKWIDALIASYESNGWRVDVNDDEKVCFALYVDEDTEWFHDYFKKDGSCIKMNGRQKVNLVCRRD